jgi:hypothetical protein
MVICNPSYALQSQCNRAHFRYYRHPADSRIKSPCARTGNRSWVTAEVLEDAVIKQLFDLFGNPAAVQRAIEEATPNAEKINDLLNRKSRLESSLAEIKAQKDRVIRFIAKGTITDDDATEQLGDLNENEARLRDQLTILTGQLENLPHPDDIKRAAEEFSSAFHDLNIDLYILKVEVNKNFDAMTWEEKRQLLRLLFAGKTSEGKRMGVYVSWDGEEARGGQRTWQYRIVGRLVDQGGIAPRDEIPLTEADPMEGASEFSGGPLQKALFKAVGQSAWC